VCVARPFPRAGLCTSSIAYTAPASSGPDERRVDPPHLEVAALRIEYTLARIGAERLWKLMQERSMVRSLGALTGNQAMQQVRAGLEAIYVSGWQVAADANNAGQMYPDQSLYPISSVPEVVSRINNALRRADEISKAEGDTSTYWYAPIVADAEAGFGGPLNAFELMI
jgi:isocitrate lyase